MYVIVVYDVNVDRVNKVHKLLRRYLYWRQRSVFDGIIDKHILNELKEKIKPLIKKDDSVIFYELTMKPNNITQYGVKKITEHENIIIN